MEPYKASDWKPSASFKTLYLPRAMSLLRSVMDSPELLEWCKGYPYEGRENTHEQLDKEIAWLIDASYSEGLVVKDYGDYFSPSNPEPHEAKQEWVEKLSFHQLLAAIAWHFRMDHFCFGSMQNDSIPSGALLRLFEELSKRLPPFESDKCIEVVGTMVDGTFLAKIQFEDKLFFAFYPAHLYNQLILHTNADYFTRFVTFYDNDPKLYTNCIDVLLRRDLKIEDKSDSRLVDSFYYAMSTVCMKRSFDVAFEKPLRYIRYTFELCPFRAYDDDEPVEKTVTKIYPDGIVEIREYEGKRVESFVRKRVEESEVRELLNDIANLKGGLSCICDAMSYAALVFSDGTVKRYSRSPICLDEFVYKLQFNSHYVLKIK